MKIQEMMVEQTSVVCSLWNQTIRTENLPYKPWQAEGMMERLFPQQANGTIHSFVAMDANDVLAFVSGTWVASSNQAYLTTLLVDHRYRNQGIGTQLLTHLERTMRANHPSMSKMETVFFNPVHLPIWINGTSMHHPNAPGVPESSALLDFLLRRGYRTYATQDVFVRRLDDVWPPSTPLASPWRVMPYDATIHHGWDTLWSDLNNPHWEHAIRESLQEHPTRPILILTDGRGIYGFAGPLHIDETGRGCFAGIGVHSSLRGQGLGKALFEQLCQIFQQMGGTYMSLFTGRENPAGTLYRKTGFVVVQSFVNLRRSW